MPALLLRLEGLLLLVLSTVAYAKVGGGWGMYALLFLAPDLSMFGYLAGKRIGATIYNIAHTYAIPLAIVLVSMLIEQDGVLSFSLIWLAHIGLDRLIGYGLKYPTDFKDTHLQRV